MARTMLPVSGLRVQGETMRPFYRPKGNGLRDIREVPGLFFVSLFDVWQQHGNEILHRVADNHPELYFAGMVMTKVALGSPGDLATLGNKESILSKLQQKAGPQARALFERFTRDLEALSKGDIASDTEKAPNGKSGE